MNNWKLIISVLIFLYCFYYLTSLNDWHFIDNVNLIIHEAGHLIFILFGYFLSIAGGTIMQLFVPTLFVGYFVFKQQGYSASLILYWVGLNLFNISVYAADALRMELPLLTGDKDTHDWNQMLFVLGLLKHTELISQIILGLGVVVVILALIWGIYESRKTVQTSIIS